MEPRTDRRYLWLFLGYPLAGLLFGLCEILIPEVINVMEWPLVDRAIPFVPLMVVPYVFWYVTIAFTFVWTGWKDPDGFVRYASYISLATISACLFYLVFPNGEQLRPDPSTFGPGWDEAMVAWIYAHDTPTNCNPSIHVIDALGIWIALGRDRILGRRGWFQVVLALISLSVIASTVMIKQHSVIDVVGGGLWAAFWATVVYSKRFPVFLFLRR